MHRPRHAKLCGFDVFTNTFNKARTMVGIEWADGVVDLQINMTIIR